MKKYKITVNGTEYEVDVEEVAGQETVPTPIQKQSVATPIATPISNNTPVAQPVQSTNSSEIKSGSEVISSPMPGTILKMNVDINQQVRKGEVLCVLEAMKMETDIVSPRDGKIASVHIAKNTTVNAGDVLLTLV